MSIRDVKNGAFQAITPESVRQIYQEHGREIANAESAGRILIAPYLFYTAARGKKGLVPGLVRGAKMIIDGHDGFVAEHDKEFATAKPVIFSANKMMLQIAQNCAQRGSTRTRAGAIMQTLRETDGSTLDQECDKYAQIADQLGASVGGDLSWLYTSLNVTRNFWVSSVRSTYRQLGVTKAGSAVPISQIKTVVMDAHQTAEATGILDRVPVLRKPLEAIGIGLTVYSAADIMISNENAYLEMLGKDPSEVNYVTKLLSSTGRTALNLAGIPLTNPVPELASHAA